MMRYERLPEIPVQGVLDILEHGDTDELLMLPLQIGEYTSDWREAQSLCLRLCLNDNPEVRANAVLGLAYTARNCGKLEREQVEPVLVRELADNETFRWRIIDAIGDINIYLGWNVAEKKMSRYDPVEAADACE